MFNSTRTHTQRGQLNWRAMKRNHKKALCNTKGGLKASKRIMRGIATDISLDVQGLRDSRLYVRNVANWL